MNEDYDTIRAARIAMAAQIMQATVIHNLEYPRATSLINEHDQLVMYVDTDAGLQGWRDYIGVDRYGSILHWQGWSVLVLSLQVEDSGAGAETGAPSPAPGTALLAEGEAAATALWTEPATPPLNWSRQDYERARAADLDATVSAILDPDATIVMPCQQSTHREVHGSHVRHEGAYSRCCDGWASAPTVQFSAVSS